MRIGDICMPDIPVLMSALSDPTRLAAMLIIWDGREHCVCELMRQLGATQSRMSRHMSVLKSARLVIDRRDAQWVRYRKNPTLDSHTAAIVDAVVAAQKSKQKKAA
jgi:ArsR family transcriptional regulator